MTNFDMAEFWQERGGELWVREAQRYDTMLEPCGRRLLEAAALQPGERVLDIGCGNGAVTLEAARRVGPDGRVTGFDLSAPMLALAGRRAAEAGLDITFVRGDAQSAAWDHPVDALISRFGVMFFDKPEAAFANLAEALSPGGRMCFVCWREMFANEWIAVPAMAAVAHVGIPDLPPPGAPGPFAFADAERVRGLLDGAGLTDITIEERNDSVNMGRDPEDVVAFMASDEMGRRLFEGKAPEAVQAATQAALDAMRPFATPEGVVVGSAYWVVTARKT